MLLEKWCQETVKGCQVFNLLNTVPAKCHEMRQDKTRCVCVQFHTPLNLNDAMFLFGFSQISLGQENLSPQMHKQWAVLGILGSKGCHLAFCSKAPLLSQQLRQSREDEQYILLYYIAFLFFFFGLENSQRNPVAEACVVSTTTQPLTYRWQQTVPPTVDGNFSSLSAKNSKAPGTQSCACHVSSSLCLGLMTLVLPGVIRRSGSQC